MRAPEDVNTLVPQLWPRTVTRAAAGDLTVGGMNAAAVEHMTQVKGGYGRLVWMSTFDAENQVRVSKETRPFEAGEIRQRIDIYCIGFGHV